MTAVGPADDRQEDHRTVPTDRPEPRPQRTDNGSVTAPSPLQAVEDDRLAARDVTLLLKRDDLLHPTVTGNKFRKLHPNLAAAVAAGHHTLLTFGGAYSNHLRATAAAGRSLGLR